MYVSWVGGSRYCFLVCLAVLVVFAPSLAAQQMEKLAHFADSQESWQKRAETVRSTILAGADLAPLPERTPLHAVFANRRVRDGYSVEDVAFEATPGFYVFGNLYRPLSATAENPAPALLVAHGHFKEEGWYARTRPENQILCATLAQMGAVVFTYDMVGYGDATQLPHDTRNVLQIQLWDSIRALDFLDSLPEVDGSRIGVTGASGGASQIIFLAAVDPRVKASMPVVMVSSRYSGHERCEDGMKIRDVIGEEDTNNAEIAAVVAPRPLMIVSDGSDWTKHFPEEDFPYIQRIYELYDAVENVHNRHLPNEHHDYGPTKRRIAYRFFSHSLGLAPAPKKETAQIESQSDQAVRNWIDVPNSYPGDFAVEVTKSQPDRSLSNSANR
jgi:uncharacterized protein